MPFDLTFFLIILLVLAAFLQEDVIFTLIYLFLGVYILGGMWSRKILAGITYKRFLPVRAFFGDDIPVRVEVGNPGWLPAVWLRIQESVPVDLSIQKNLKQVVSLGPRGKTRFEYLLRARKRGYYRIGPLFVSSGDLIGFLREQQREGTTDHLIIYPRIVHLTNMKLPSRSPMGTMRHTQPIFEDPTRVLSKRDYVAGDSLRRVDWKATAATGRMQVKQFEPSIALETVVFLNLNNEEYDVRSRIDSTEQAIVVAASICNWVVGKKQSAGLITNGVDPLITGDPYSKAPVDSPQLSREAISREALVMRDAASAQPAPGAAPDLAEPVPPRKGQAHLMRILDVLARIQAANTIPLAELIRREYLGLPWGTTLIVVTGQVDDALFDQLFQVRRGGMNLVVVLVGPVPGAQEIQNRAASFNIPLYPIRSDKDMDIWRR
jgi:uncharacterized protein (DUF58 family)